MSKDNNKTNNMFGFDEGVDDEYFIDEIIGIEELPYKEFVKEDKKSLRTDKDQLEFNFDE